MNNAASMQANMFHAGNTCPFCQEQVEEGQMIVRCDKCGAIHHDLCWLHGEGCSSYHCSKKVKTDFEAPELLITAAETRNVVPLVKPVRRSAERVAREYISPRPSKVSKLAIAALVLAVFSACGFFGVAFGSVKILTLGVVVCVAALSLGVISAVVINNSSKTYGMLYSAVSVMGACSLLVVFFAFLYSMTRAGIENSRVNLQLSERMPTEEELGRMEPYKANAMRANVVVSRGGNLMQAQIIGSGVVLRKQKQKALILTNKHVIGEDAAGAIHVLFCNGESSEAKVEWRAPGEIDLAVISCQVLTMDKLQPVSVSSSLAGQGEKTFAVGNPMNLSWSYTEGVISAIREKNYDGHSVAIYQTQTPINQGNSGGGLYDRDGTLIGINTWTRDKSVSEGLSFSISSSSFLDLLPIELRGTFLDLPGHSESNAREGNE